MNFDDWLSTATLSRASAEVLQRPDLLSLWDDLARRWERAERVAAASERGIEDADPMAEMETEATALLAEIEASRTVFHVRGILPADVEAIEAAHPIPTQPRFTGKLPSVQQNATEAQSKAFLGMWESYRLQQERWESEHADELAEHRARTLEALRFRGAERVARATVKVEQGGSEIASSLTVEQVLALADRIGEPQLLLILAAIDKASTAEPEVDTSFLSKRSGSDRG